MRSLTNDKSYKKMATNKYRQRQIIWNCWDFFNHSSSVEVDTAKLNGHIENDDTHCTGKLGFMSNDRKHVIVIREFSSADDYDIWSTKRKELGDIDNLIEEEEMKIESGEEYDFDVAQEA